MIKSLYFSNFKCFHEVENFSLGDLTLVSGLNNSGKSSLYQLLLILKQSYINSSIKTEGVIPKLRINGSIIQLGKSIEILNNIDKKVISLKIEFKENVVLCFEFILESEIRTAKTNKNENNFVLNKFSMNTINCEVNDRENIEFFRNKQGKYTVKAFTILSFSDFVLENTLLDYMNKKLSESKKQVDSIYNIFSKTVSFSSIYDYSFFGFILFDIKIKINDIRKCLKKEYAQYFDAKDFIAELNKKNYGKDYGLIYFTLNVSYPHDLLSLIRNFTKRISCVLPFRGEPRRIYNEIGTPNPLIISRENMSKKINYSCQKGRMKTGTLGKALKYWIPLIIDDIDDFNINILVEGIISETIIKIGDKNIAIPNVGFGISQILPLLVKVLLVKDNSMCIIDEPEVHLHPALQSRLADFFIEMIKLKKQIIIETHSEYIINRILYKKLIDNDLNIKMYWIIRENGISSLQAMECDELGYIINKPKGFLDGNDDIISKLNNERIKRI